MLSELSAEMYITTSLNANTRNIYIHGMITDCKYFPLQKHFVTIWKNSTSAAEGNPRWAHQKVSTHKSRLCILRSPVTGGIKSWVLDCTQQDLPDRRKIKDSKDMQGYLACGL